MLYEGIVNVEGCCYIIVFVSLDSSLFLRGRLVLVLQHCALSNSKFYAHEESNLKAKQQLC